MGTWGYGGLGQRRTRAVAVGLGQCEIGCGIWAETVCLWLREPGENLCDTGNAGLVARLGDVGNAGLGFGEKLGELGNAGVGVKQIWGKKKLGNLRLWLKAWHLR